MSVEKLIAEIRELDRDTVPVKATFESGLPPEEFLYLKRNHILTLCRIIEVQSKKLIEISENKTMTILGPSQFEDVDDLRGAHCSGANKAFVQQAELADEALAESDRIAKEGKE